jgi:cytosine/adenosine deaminase-related metal-dependent hydrolase
VPARVPIPLERKVRTLAPGNDANIVILRTDAINVMAAQQRARPVVLATETSNVSTAFIAGRAVKQGAGWSASISRASGARRHSRAMSSPARQAGRRAVY